MFEHSGNFFFKDVETEAVWQGDTLNYCLKRVLIPNWDGFPRVVFSTLSTSPKPASIWSLRPCTRCPSKAAQAFPLWALASRESQLHATEGFKSCEHWLYFSLELKRDKDQDLLYINKKWTLQGLPGLLSLFYIALLIA